MSNRLPVLFIAGDTFVSRLPDPVLQQVEHFGIPSITVNDVDSGSLSGATVAISAGFTAGDLLSCSTQNGISSTYNAATGVLTLNGTASVDQYQAALRSVSYSSSSNNSTVSSASRTISWVTNDGGALNNLSAAATSRITITAANPTITLSAPTATGYLNLSQIAETLTLSGAVTSADGQTVTVTLLAGSTTAAILTTTASAGAWSVTVPATTLGSLPQGTISVRAAVSPARPAPTTTASNAVSLIDPAGPAAPPRAWGAGRCSHWPAAPVAPPADR
jgi:hypothetical protein